MPDRYVSKDLDEILLPPPQVGAIWEVVRDGEVLTSGMILMVSRTIPIGTALKDGWLVWMPGQTVPEFWARRGGLAVLPRSSVANPVGGELRWR